MELKFMDGNKENSLIKWMPEDKIIVLSPLGDFSKEKAQTIVDEITKIIEKVPKEEKLKLIVDATGTNKTNHEARRIYTEFTKKYKGKVSKVAMFKANTFTKLVTQFVLSAAGRGGDLKFFENLEDGLDWIKKQK